MASTKRTVLIGATLAIVLVAAVVGWLVLRGGVDGVGVGTQAAAPSKVVVVFAMAGEDNAVTAQMVAVVDAVSGKYELAETSATVTIPGTSYTQLRDAYPFGGAKAVAAALEGGAVEAGTAWVDVSPEAWMRLLKAGVDTTITEPFETYDEDANRFTEFEEGPRHVTADELRGLVNGAPYLGADARRTIVEALAATSLRELASTTPSGGIDTDLTPVQWTAFVRGLNGK